MKKTVIAMMLVVTAMFIAGTVLAWGGDCEPGGGKNGKCLNKEEMKKELGVTPEQDRLLENCRTKCSAEAKSAREAFKAKKEELRSAISKPGATKEGVQPIVAELKALQAKMTDARVDGIFALKEILTPEQFTKLEAMKEKRMKEWKEKHKDGGKRHKGPKPSDGPEEM